LFLKELQHVLPRSILKGVNWVKDPINKFANVVNWDNNSKKYVHSGITIRKSGCLDFYSNYRLVEETKSSFKETV
jgi:hypothetical protein